MSGRSRSLATTLFFEAQILSMDELPDRPIVDLQPALGEFGDKPTQGEVPCPGALQQPITVLPRNLLRLVPTHLARRNAASLSEAPNPENGRVDAHPKLRRRPVTGQATLIDGRNHPLAKIHRIRFAHPCWPPPASMLNQSRPDLGIPNRINLTSSRSSRPWLNDSRSTLYHNW